MAFAWLLLLPCSVCAEDYVVGKKDVLKIVVFKEKDFSGDFPVDLNGNLNYPVVGDIPVEGKSVGEIKKLLTDILAKDYLINPRVVVTIKEYKSKKVTVVGSVTKPGIYTLKERVRLLDVLSMAGGITKEASSRLVVLRKVRDKEGIGGKELKSDSATESLNVAESSAETTADSAAIEIVREEGPEELRSEGKGKKAQAKGGKPSEDLLDGKQKNIRLYVGSGIEVSSDAPNDQFAGEKHKGNEGADKGDESKKGNLKTKEIVPSNTPFMRMREFKPIMVNYDQILKGTDLSQNIEILGGDIINVPMANEIFVLGSVKSPGPVKYSENMGVLQAVSLAGGPTPEAAAGSTYILRTNKKGKKKKIKVNYKKVLKEKGKNVPLKPDDVIVVPESFF